MPRAGYPPEPCDSMEPQQELCDLCSSLVGAMHLQQSDVDGLRGYWICDTNPDCASFRSNVPFQQVVRTNPTPQGFGNGRRLPGSSTPLWWNDSGSYDE
mgnify:CR=1 FL=1